jgi:hypothetical protein
MIRYLQFDDASADGLKPSGTIRGQAISFFLVRLRGFRRR